MVADPCVTEFLTWLGLPRWVSYLGYLVGLTLMLAAGTYEWTQLVFPAWVLLVGVVLLMIRPAAPQPTARATPGG